MPTIVPATAMAERRYGSKTPPAAELIPRLQTWRREGPPASVSVSFSPVHDRSDETEAGSHPRDRPPMNAGERPRSHPNTPTPQHPNTTVGKRAPRSARDVRTRVHPDRLMPPAMRPALCRARCPRLGSQTHGAPTGGGGTVGEWKQGKCGWPTGRGRCRNKTLKGTSRCYLHQGEWTKRGQAELKKRASKRRKK